MRFADGLLRSAGENRGRPYHHPLDPSGFEERSRAPSPADRPRHELHLRAFGGERLGGDRGRPRHLAPDTRQYYLVDCLPAGPSGEPGEVRARPCPRCLEHYRRFGRRVDQLRGKQRLTRLRQEEAPVGESVLRRAGANHGRPHGIAAAVLPPPHEAERLPRCPSQRGVPIRGRPRDRRQERDAGVRREEGGRVQLFDLQREGVPAFLERLCQRAAHHHPAVRVDREGCLTRERPREEHQQRRKPTADP